MMPARRRPNEAPAIDWSTKDTAVRRHLYFVQSYPGTLIKIGATSFPWKRFVSLQGGCPVPLWLIGVVWDGGFQERQLHTRFQHLREHHEWFRSDPELLAYIAEHATDACDPLAPAEAAS